MMLLARALKYHNKLVNTTNIASTINSCIFCNKISDRKFSLNHSAATLKSIDDIPGDFELNEQDTIRSMTDSVNFFNEKYEIAKAFDPQSPMIKMNFMGAPSIALFSHDLIKQYQEYEFKGQTQRMILPIFTRLLGQFSHDAHGKVHIDWRKKASKSFKPNTVDRLTPFIQQTANEILLNGIASQSNESGESLYFAPLVKRFAFEIGTKFVMGPMMDPKEIKDLFQV